MNTPTEAHYQLAHDILQSSYQEESAQLIAASEARACDQLRAELEKLAITTAQAQDRNLSHRLEREKAEAERTDAIYQRACEVERELRAEVENEAKWAAHYLAQSIADKARAERAEAELADWSVLKGWGGTPEIVHKFIKGQQHRIHYCQNLEAELATERARLNDLVADIKDVCITLASAKDDCDDYAMQNTAFKLEAVRDVLIQYIPNAAMKEDAK